MQKFYWWHEGYTGFLVGHCNHKNPSSRIGMMKRQRDMAEKAADEVERKVREIQMWEHISCPSCLWNWSWSRKRTQALEDKHNHTENGELSPSLGKEFCQQPKWEMHSCLQLDLGLVKLLIENHLSKNVSWTFHKNVIL